MSLREEMIERMAQATAVSETGCDWDNLYEVIADDWRGQATVALDALLDGLEADQSWVPNCDYECNCGRGLGLVAALRGESA